MEPTPVICISACQSFRPVATSFFQEKLPILAFLIQEGVWPYRYAYDVSLVTLILNVYGFVGLTSTVPSVNQRIYRPTRLFTLYSINKKLFLQKPSE